MDQSTQDELKRRVEEDKKIQSDKMHNESRKEIMDGKGEES